MPEIRFYVYRGGYYDKTPAQFQIYDGSKFIKDEIDGFVRWSTGKISEPRHQDPAFQFQHMIEQKYIPKEAVNVKYLQAVFFDIDTHTPAQKKNLINDTDTKTVDEALVKLLTSMKSDPYIFFATKSKSGTGLRIILLIENVDKDNQPILNASTEELQRNHRYNAEKAAEYLMNKYAIKLHGSHWRYSREWDSKENYLDAAPLRNMVQNSYRCSDCPQKIVNYHPRFLRIQVVPTTIVKSVYQKIQSASKINVNEQDKENQRFVNKLMAESDGSFLKDALSNHDPAYLLAFVGLDEEQKKWFYKRYSKYYQGDHVVLSSFEEFDAYLHEQAKYRKYAVSLQDYCEALGFTSITSKNIFGYEYDHVITFNEFASECATEIKQIINKHSKVIIDAEPGVGKTTLVLQLMADLYGQGKERKYSCYASPKNIINNQVYQLMKKRYSQIPLYRNYTNDANKIIGADDKEQQKFVFISSYQSLGKLVDKGLDVLFIDEVQDLINYADISGQKQVEFPKTVKQVFFSATPEVFMVGGTEKYYSVRLVKNGAIKSRIDVIPTNNIFEFGLDFIRSHKDENILIYLNNKTKGLNLAATLKSEGIKVGLINANTKGSEQNRKLVEEQMLAKGIWVGTDLINAGVNILNDDMDYVLMLTDQYKDIFKIKQFPERIRKKKKVKIILATTFNAPTVKYGNEWQIVKKSISKKDAQYSQKLLAAREEFEQKKLNETLQNPVYKTVLPNTIRKRLDTFYEIKKAEQQKIADYYNLIADTADGEVPQFINGAISGSAYNNDSQLNNDLIFVKNGRVEINKNRIKNAVVSEAMTLITNHPSIYRHYLSKLFSIKWEKAQNFETSDFEKELDIFTAYPNEISTYITYFQGRDSEFLGGFPEMNDKMENIKRNLAKYTKLSKRYAVAVEFNLDWQKLIYSNKFDDIASGKIMDSFNRIAATTIIDKVKKQVYKDVIHEMYFSVKFKPKSTEEIFNGLSSSSKDFFEKTNKDPVQALGTFVSKYIKSIDANWSKKQFRFNKGLIWKWRYELKKSIQYTTKFTLPVSDKDSQSQ